MRVAQDWHWRDRYCAGARRFASVRSARPVRIANGPCGLEMGSLDMSILRGVLALAVLLAVAFAFSDARRRVQLRTVGAALVLEIVFAFLVLRWIPGAPR